MRQFERGAHARNPLPAMTMPAFGEAGNSRALAIRTSANGSSGSERPLSRRKAFRNPLAGCLSTGRIWSGLQLTNQIFQGVCVGFFDSRTLASLCDEAALIGHCKERLSAYKVPDRIFVVDEIPRTGSGKILRVKLREGLPGA